MSLLLDQKAHCGIDLLENCVNAVPPAPARRLPQVLHVDGLCTVPLPPILGPEIPTWSLVWFGVLMAALAAETVPAEPAC